jgi:hypothetical protein
MPWSVTLTDIRWFCSNASRQARRNRDGFSPNWWQLARKKLSRFVKHGESGSKGSLTNHERRWMNARVDHSTIHDCVPKLDHKTVNYSNATKTNERRQILQRKRLWFKSFGPRHNNSSICKSPPRRTNIKHKKRTAVAVVAVHAANVCNDRKIQCNWYRQRAYQSMS